MSTLSVAERTPHDYGITADMSVMIGLIENRASQTDDEGGKGFSGLVPYKPTTAIKNKLFHHEGTKGTKFINHLPLLRVLRAFVVRIPGCGLRPR